MYNIFLQTWCYCALNRLQYTVNIILHALGNQKFAWLALGWHFVYCGSLEKTCNFSEVCLYSHVTKVYCKVFFKIRFQKFNTVNFRWAYFHQRVLGALMSAKAELSYQDKVSPSHLYSIYKYPLQITCFKLIKDSQ